MRHNHDKHAKRPEDIYQKCDVVYADLPQIRNVYRLDVLPLKTIYYNRAADDRTFYRHVFKDLESFENFCDKYGIEIW